VGIKVFLGNAPWYRPGYYGVRAGSRWPHFEVQGDNYMPFPFQLAYAAAMLEERGVETLLVDGVAERISEERFLARIKEFQPDWTVLEVSSPSFNADLRIAAKVREVLGRDKKIIFCGLHAPMYEPQFLDRHPEVDMVMVGEYELTLAEAAVAAAQGAGLDQVPGLILRDGAGRPFTTGPRQVIEDIDALPWPARHFLPMMNYWDNPGELPPPILQMWASRGCPYGCTFCNWPQLMNGNRYRARDMGQVLEEIEQVSAEYGFKSVYFDDDTFNVGKQRMLAFCREKKRRGLDFPWAIMARADLMDREILEAMAGAGLTGVKYGVESADERLTDHVNKNLDLGKAVENIKLTKALGIRVHLTFMFGIPGENRRTVNQTINLAKELDPNSVQFSILTPLPGTKIYQELLDKGHLIEADWDRYDGYNSAVIRTDDLTSEELVQAVRRAWRAWFLNRARHHLSFRDLAFLARRLPAYILRPTAGLNQVKRLLHV